MSGPKIDHIINGSKGSNHQWQDLVPDKNWSGIKSIIANVMENGAEVPYKSVSSKVLMVDGKLVQVTYTTVKGVIRISDAWVK